MSYRNPQVIIDRSGEIWGQAIAGFGKDAARGIDNYAAAKEKNQEITRKQKQAKQLTANGVSQKFLESIEQISSGIKDPSISEQFKDTAKMMANVGEEITVNGKSFKIGAIEAQTELKMNPNLDKDTREAYSQIVADFKGYQTGMVSSAGNIISGLDGLANSTTGMIGKTMDYQGQGFQNTQSQVAAYSLLGKQMEGVTSKKVLGRVRGEDGKYRNMLTINSSIDTNSKTFKELEAAGLISRDDLTFEEGSDIGSFSWERDLATWGEEGDLIVDIAPEGDTTEALRIAGFTDDEGNATGLGFNKNVVYSSRGVKGGVETTAEEHFDPDALRNNPAYDAELKGSAAGILALPLDQQIKYISNTLGWPTIKQNEWANATPQAQQSFLMEQRFEKDLQKLMGAGGKNRVKTRDATSSDVAAYKADGIELDLLNEDGTPTKVYYTSKGNPSITPKGDTETTVNGGKEFYNEIKKNPVGMYQEYVGVKPIFNREKNTITIGKESVSGYDADEPELTKDVVYNMNDSTDRNRFYLNLLKASERTKGTSLLSKEEQKGYEDALRSDTSYRSSKLDKKKKEAEAKAKAKADAEAKAKADALKKEMKEAAVYKKQKSRGNQVTKRD
tara:strand:+ start:1344 stop:3194 length:1851 start_codon:yes stop_codon:yes gene_type:complete